MSQLYTFLLEYAGGIYISQYRGSTVREALSRWARGESVNLIAQWRHSALASPFPKLADETPLALEGLGHVWCASANVASKLALLNIVATVSDKAKNA